MKQYEIEVERKVFDNENGAHIKVGPDRDGLGLIQIEGGDDFGKGLILAPELALVLAEAIAATAKEMLA